VRKASQLDGLKKRDGLIGTPATSSATTEVTYLDTHVLIWLYLGDVDRLPERAKLAIERDSLWASPATVLEVEYLHEIPRIAYLAAGEKRIRDPFDRLNVANAKA